ncbi:MAG: tetratricopeptide repeat protein [Prolixibacteraceae bacterium]
MNKESRNFQEEQEIHNALQRYEEMLRKGLSMYFDVFQLEYIIDNFLEDGKIYQALQVVEMGMNQHPTSLALKIKKANILLNLGEVSNSLELTNELVKIEDTNHELHLLKGSSHLLLGQSDEAVRSFNLSLKYSSEDRDETLFNIGFAYEQIGDYHKAVHYLEEAVLLDLENEEAMYELAFCYEKIGENKKSIACYDKYLDLEAFSDSAWFNLGILYTKIEDFEKSVWAYELALALNEDFPNAWFNLGHSYMLLGKFEKAIGAFTSFNEFDAENDDIYCFIADCYIGLDKEKLALKNYQKARKINALNAKAWYGSGLIEKNRGNIKSSFDHLKKAVKIDEENSDFHYSFALVAAEMNRFKEASNSFDAAIELNPLELDYWLSYAEVLYQRGMVVTAIETLKLANEFHTDRSEINFRLAAYYLDSMNDKEARGHLQKALESNNSNLHLFLDSFPEAINSKWVNKLIKKYHTFES